MGINSEIIHGHDLLAVERFKDATHHMIIFDILSRDTPYGEKGQRMRLFLTDSEYTQAQAAHKARTIKILRHAFLSRGISSRTKNANGATPENNQEEPI